MNKFITVFFLLLFNSFSLYAIVLDDPDTTHVPVHPSFPSIPEGDPFNDPHKSPNQGNIIIGDLYGTTLSFSSSSFIHSSIEVIVTDSNDVEYVNTIVYEYNSLFIIDISSLPIGIYTISITDGDDEYVGEFEVF